jgi:hypothetical protein
MGRIVLGARIESVTLDAFELREWMTRWIVDWSKDLSMNLVDVSGKGQVLAVTCYIAKFTHDSEWEPDAVREAIGPVKNGHPSQNLVRSLHADLAGGDEAMIY